MGLGPRVRAGPACSESPSSLRKPSIFPWGVSSLGAGVGGVLFLLSFWFMCPKQGRSGYSISVPKGRLSPCFVFAFHVTFNMNLRPCLITFTNALCGLSAPCVFRGTVSIVWLYRLWCHEGGLTPGECVCVCACVRPRACIGVCVPADRRPCSLTSPDTQV